MMQAILNSPLRRVMALTAVLALVAMTFFVNAPRANAAGSDSPTPYSVTETGIQLPVGDSFRDNGHVNIRATGSTWTNLHFEGKCIERTDAECAGDRHAAAQYIGQNFIPWSAFGLQGQFCVEWVQISHYNEHFGEGGQSPVCVGGTTPEPPTKPEPVVENLNDQRTSCEAGVEERIGTRTTDWVLDEEANEYVQSDPVEEWGDWTFVRNLTDEESVELGCESTPEPPVKPEPIVENLNDQRTSCEVGLEERTGTSTTDWVLDETTNEYVKSEPVIEWGDWEYVRDLTDEESAELGCEAAPSLVLEPAGSVFAFCDGTGVATFDNSLSEAAVSFELVVNGEVVMTRSVEPGDVLTVSFEGAEPNSDVIVQDQDGNELARDTVPDACEEPPTYVSVTISSVCTKEGGGAITITNPQDNSAIVVLYGDYSEANPDGEVTVTPGASETIPTERTTLDVEIYSADGWFLDSFEDVAVAQDCGDDTTPPPSSKQTPSGNQPAPSGLRPNAGTSLAVTGASDWMPAVAAAGTLLLLGAGVMLAARRRSSSS